MAKLSMTAIPGGYFHIRRSERAWTLYQVWRQLPQDAKVGGKNFGVKSEIQRAKFGAPTRISEANFGAKPPTS